MQLKRIELAGFKSFAEKTSIEFHEGVTAVVGPNGSGKSNITEAIRWVMGEQSAKNLRGGRMNDVIFAGSETRKSVNRAEVTLVLDNEDHFLPLDFSEVSITRRLLRNGDSEFFINQQPCRLKDIVDLFMDSGLGKESFSIISQGKVEAVFNSKPEDRRAIFEEAAGVLKYKSRKKKAENKLAETQDNLNRVQDIVHELESQREPLKEQSSIAKDFLLQKEQLSRIETSLMVHEIVEAKKEWDVKSKEIIAFDSQLANFKKSLSGLEEQIGVTKAEKQQISKQLEKAQADLLQIVRDYEQAEGQRNLLQEQSKNSKESRQHYEGLKNQLTAKIKNHQTELQKINVDLKNKAADQTKKVLELQKVEKEREALLTSSEETIEKLRELYIDRMQKQTGLKNELNYLERSHQQVRLRNVKSFEQQARLEDEITSEKEHTVHTVEELEALQKAIAEKLLYHQEKQAALQKMRNSLDKKERNMYEALRIVQQAKAKRDSLQELQEEYAGFYQGVRQILHHRDQLGGIVGAVAELIEVPKESELAIETTLGASSQYIVVEDEETARKGIEYLKRKRFGRATFLPLSTISARGLSPSVLNKVNQHRGFVGIASEIVHFPEKISTIVQNLLGTTIVARDLETANEIARLIQFKYRVVTYEGDLMNAGGSMTGGASRKGNEGSLFTRKNELAILSKQVLQMEESLQAEEISFRSLKQSVKKEESELETLRETGESLRIEEQQLKHQLEISIEKKIRLSRELKAHQFENQEADEETVRYQQEVLRIQKEMSSNQEEMDQMNHQLQLMTSQKAEREDLLLEVNETRNHLNADLASLKEQLSNLKKEQKNLSSLLEEESNELAILEKQILHSEDSSGLHQLSQDQLIQRLEELKKAKEATLTMISTKKEAAEKSDIKLEELESKNQLENQQKEVLLSMKSKAEIQMNRADVTIENRLNYLNQEYGMSFEAAEATVSLAIPVEEARRTVKLLKQGIEELGTVNIGAIEEFERVDERYTFLVEQKEDLLEARASLYETMDEMDIEVKKRFLETFESIQSKFAKVFPKIFGGGSAELRLVDPDNLLTTGIDIIAQPPGKKLQNLSLLSGGERALTAIALLFSIIQVRPVPFCILDEAEAALDEANVLRFGQYLHQFEGQTQFIVITHRKGTMGEADVLYGVTMQESGISKVVSVRMEEISEAPAAI